MRKAILIFSFISIPLTIFMCIEIGNEILETLKTLEEERVIPYYNFDKDFFIIISSIISVVITILFIIIGQGLLSKGKKVTAGILTIIFVSKIAGILMFCIPRDQLNDSKVVEGEGTTSGWTCPECRTRNVLVDVCSKCGYTSPEASKAYSEKINQILAEDEKNNTATRARNKCPYCGKVVSKFDESCPYCGHKLF